MTFPRERKPTLRWLAGAGGVLVAVLGAVAAAASVRLGWSWADAADAFVVTNAAIGLSFGLCGAVLAWHRPANPIGWLFLVGGLMQCLAAATSPLTELAQQADAPLPVVRTLSTVFVYSWTWNIALCAPLGLMLFPDGRPPGRGWRWVVAGTAVNAPLFVLALGAAPVPVQEGDPVGYLTIAAYRDLALLWRVAELSVSVVWLLALVAMVVRYRRGTETVRRQLLWLILALLATVSMFVVWDYVDGAPVLVLLAVPLIPLAVTIAVVRHGLLDIRLVVSRALAWSLLSLAVLVAYVALVALLDRVVANQVGRSTLVTVILVLVAAPVLPRLQRVVDRAMYGDRANPTRVVSRMGEHFAADSGLDVLAAAVRDALRLPYVAVLGGRGESLGASGVAPEDTWSQPLRYAAEPVGHLVVGLRPGERRLAGADRRVLDLLAGPLAVALHATRVSEDLRASRQLLVETREEERRRLRRELHDGLGPALTGIAMTADAGVNLADDREQVTELVTRLGRDARRALADVRRVVDGLRPPALDELGLLGALGQRVDQLSWRADGTRMRVRLDAPQRVPALPAAVEVAAYRIATEALTNAARHSRAASVEVRLRVGPDLEVWVDDDGPPNGAWTPGVGLEAMAERASELGGSFSAGPSARGGRVHASLPVEVEAP